MIILYLSYDLMSLIVQLLAIVCICAYGMKASSINHAVKFGFKMMFITAIISHAVITGPGPSFLPALICLPAFGALFGWGSAVLLKSIKASRVNRN